MPSSAPYIPTKDADLTNWLENFQTLIAANPPVYGLTTTDSSNITAQVQSWVTAYTLVISPSTKTPAAVQAKNTAKVITLAIIRPYAQQIAKNAGVTSSNKIALGLNPQTSTPTPITTPTTAPVLTAQSSSTAGTIIRYRDATASPSVKSKPYGVTQIQLFAMASATPITDPALLPLQGVYTKAPLTAAMGNAAAGKVVYYAGRWVTAKGLIGPWSSIISYIAIG
jgi:hypothetical protein